MSDRVCAYCKKPLPAGARSNQVFCSRTHKRQARRQAKRREEIHDRLVAMAPLYGELEPMPERPDPRDDPRNYDDYGLPGDEEDAADFDRRVAEWEEDDRRFRELVGVHTVQTQPAQARPRRSWFSLRKRLAQNPGVDPDFNVAEVIRERDAQRAATIRELQSRPGQAEDRFNPATKSSVKDRAIESRKLNKMYANADPQPNRQEFDYSGSNESVDGNLYRGGSIYQGQRSRHADFQWRMDDGFRF